ncbi:MAG: glycine cleavage system aminomethyltransferase GcvT [Frankiaceae bacterium]
MPETTEPVDAAGSQAAPPPSAATSAATPAAPDGLLRSALHDWHVARGAKMADFGGWHMPIEYPDGGVIREHAAVRERAGLFDVSHLGKIEVRGPGARELVNSCLTNDLGRIGPGQAQYTLCCDETGGVVDDLIAYLDSDELLHLVPNAANAAEVLRRFQAAAPGGVELIDRHHELATIAVQGPRSFDLVAAVGLPTELSYMAFARADWQGAEVIVCRTGYTGERGFELMPPAVAAVALWEALLEAGASVDALPCGLGARDTLRTEMGYPLHGHDLSLDITPVQARLRWAVGWDKPAFWGRDALQRERADGPRRVLWGLESLDRGIPRQRMTVTTPEGAPVGEVTSGTFSPTRRIGIGLALLDASVGEGDEVRVDVRGRSSAMRVVKPPFVAASTK